MNDGQARSGVSCTDSDQRQAVSTNTPATKWPQNEDWIGRALSKFLIKWTDKSNCENYVRLVNHWNNDINHAQNYLS